MAEQLEFYFPKTKSKHMAYAKMGKQYPSKGGTVRYGVQAIRDGSKSLPKYITEEDFNKYGFEYIRLDLHKNCSDLECVVNEQNGFPCVEVKINPSYKYPQEFIDAHYHMDSNPMLTGDDSNETVELAYQAWYQKQAENEVLNAEVSVGEKRIMSRKDYDIDNELSGFSNMEIGDVDLGDYEDEITEAVEDEIIESIRESVDDSMPISDGENISSYVNVDTELEITVPISGDIDYDWTANETHEEEVDDDEWNAETGLETEPEVFGGSNYAVKMIKNAQNHLKMVREAETISKDMTFNIDIEDASIENEDELEERGYSQDEIENMREEITSRMLKNGTDEILESIKDNHLDSVGGDTYYIFEDSVYLKNRDEMVEDVEATIDYEVDAGGWSAESFEAEKKGWDIKEYGNKDKYASKDGVEVIIAPIRKSSYQYHPRDAKWKLTYGRETPHGVVPLAKLFGTYEDVFRWLNNPPFEVKSFGADTVGNPSPSSPLEEVPATVPSPAEPTNESFNAEKLHPGLYRYKGKIGLRRGWTECQECDDLVKLNDINWYYLKGYGEATVCDSCVGKYNYKKDRLSKGHRHGELAILQFMEQDKKGAEMDELSEDTSIIRNRVGDMVGMVELDENDEDIEKVDVDIIDDDGEMAYEGTLGAETFESQGTNTKMILGITALAVGLGLWKGKEIMSISEKITESIKNMRK